jgi:small subunit ribosomal protein S6
MADSQNRLYEGMFLLNPAQISASIAQATQAVKGVLDRANAEVEAIYKWDDRKLAYEIEGQKRGLYILSYFRVPGPKVSQIEHDVNFSEEIMRCLIIRADHIGETELETARQYQRETVDAAALESADESSGPTEAAVPPQDEEEPPEGAEEEEAQEPAGASAEPGEEAEGEQR